MPTYRDILFEEWKFTISCFQKCQLSFPHCSVVSKIFTPIFLPPRNRDRLLREFAARFWYQVDCLRLLVDFRGEGEEGGQCCDIAIA